jgi:hypothetical protein
MRRFWVRVGKMENAQIERSRYHPTSIGEAYAASVCRRSDQHDKEVAGFVERLNSRTMIVSSIVDSVSNDVLIHRILSDFPGLE